MNSINNSFSFLTSLFLPKWYNDHVSFYGRTNSAQHYWPGNSFLVHAGKFFFSNDSELYFKPFIAKDNQIN